MRNGLNIAASSELVHEIQEVAEEALLRFRTKVTPLSAELLQAQTITMVAGTTRVARDFTCLLRSNPETGSTTYREQFLVALGGCALVTIVQGCSARGITLMRASVRARGQLTFDSDYSPRVDNLACDYDLDCDGDADSLLEITKFASCLSPNYRTFLESDAFALELSCGGAALAVHASDTMESNDIVDETNSLDSADTEVSIHWVYGTQLVARLADGRELLIDQPKQYGGLDSAPNPPEYLLCAAGAELTARLLAQARRSDWQLPKFSIVSEGSVHLCGITNLDENAPVRMYDLTQRVEFEKASDPSEFVAIVRAAARQTHAHAIVRRPLEIQATVTHRSEKLSEFTTNLQMLREYMSELAARKQRGR